MKAAWESFSRIAGRCQQGFAGRFCSGGTLALDWDSREGCRRIVQGGIPARRQAVLRKGLGLGTPQHPASKLCKGAQDRILQEPRQRGTEASSVVEEYIHPPIGCPLALDPGSGGDAAPLRPTAWLIPAQGSRPGFMAPFPHRRPTACFIGLTRLVSVRMGDESRFQRWESSLGRHTQGECPGLV